MYMGFVYVVTKIMAKRISISCITFLLNMLSYFKSMFTRLLAHLGLVKLPDEEAPEDPITTSYVLIIEGPNPTMVTIPLRLLTSLIEKRLPVVQCRKLLERFGIRGHTNSVCSICLDCIEKTQEIRELRNCCHLFHRECLDTWVDEGQVTCPLCRSMLFPAKGESLE